MDSNAAGADDFWNVLGSRSMCRSFQRRPISERSVERITQAAFRGPSAGNTAGLDLLVLTGSSVDEYWDVTLPSAARSSFRWPQLLDAPVLVIPVVDPAAYVVRYSEPDKASTGLGQDEAAWAMPYWFVDGGAAVMAMLLAAEAVGLGALFFGQFDHEPAVSERFGIPPGRRSLGTMALGHPTAEGHRPSKSARYGRPAAEHHIHHICW